MSQNVITFEGALALIADSRKIRGLIRRGLKTEIVSQATSEKDKRVRCTTCGDWIPNGVMVTSFGAMSVDIPLSALHAVRRKMGKKKHPIGFSQAKQQLLIQIVSAAQVTS